jgi:hypothetical protein
VRVSPPDNLKYVEEKLKNYQKVTQRLANGEFLNMTLSYLLLVKIFLTIMHSYSLKRPIFLLITIY